MTQTTDERTSQKEIIRQFLENGGRLTSLKALEVAGSLRVSERIRELEADGMKIHRERIKVGRKTVMEYSMEAK